METITVKLSSEDRDFLLWLSHRRRTAMKDLLQDAVRKQYRDELAAYETATGNTLIKGIWLPAEDSA